MWYASAPSNNILGYCGLASYSGWEPPLVPVELCPLPSGQGGALKQEAPPFRAG